ncbi:peptidylprolyl isomerase [Candidatus Enterococcus willemsii]|uniref:peptidylprolyl isomerase n=1 Tax=Candidatus Enterococcus willemsii TaxID=1857215 RepID=A0ABQ6YXB0_9ENTE|nr:peptidylprolyl isomerase [Enterococcus sp. CU12B]KAF1302467.1 hypothetical protein BAU17_13950 [Enterococcus sp. CU12B]
MKKMMLGSIIISLGLFSGCSMKDSSLASIQGESITQKQLYNELKEEYGEKSLQTLLTTKVLERKYGKLVSDENVQNEMKEVSQQFENQAEFEQSLLNVGYSSIDSYIKAIRQNLLIQEMVKDSIQLSDTEMQEILNNLINFELIQVENINLAESLIEQLEKGTTFKELVANSSLDINSAMVNGNTGLIDSRDDSIYPASVLKEAMKMNNGELHKEPIETDDGFYIIKMKDNFKLNGSKLDDNKELIENYVVDTKSKDVDYVQNQLSKLFDEYEVSISDDNLSDTLELLVGTND